MAELVMQDFAAAVAPLGADWGVFGDESDLAGFKLLLCPPLYLSNPALIDKLTAYVRAGGNLLLTARSGVKDMSNVNLMRPLPGPFAALAGVEVDEYANIDKDTHYEIELPGGRVEAQKVRELLLPAKGAAMVGVHRGAWMEGKPAITCRRLGKGRVWYVGSLPAVAAWRTILKGVLAECGCDFRTDIPEGVEIARRTGKGKTLTFVINHSAARATLDLRKPGKDILTGKQVQDTLKLAPYAVAVLTGRG
jgi:beta-galactosidase